MESVSGINKHRKLIYIENTLLHYLEDYLEGCWFELLLFALALKYSSWRWKCAGLAPGGSDAARKFDCGEGMG